MAILTLEQVTKVFQDSSDSIVAIDDLSINTKDGEFIVLVGPSGCGKSTTLRMIAGLETPTEGEIRIDDKIVNDQQPQERDMAMVFQSYALYPHMSVRENMRFGLEESTDLPDDEIDQRVEETAAMMDISDLLDRNPGELSGGQQQRIALGRAIVRDPQVFLLDEPLANLDAKLRSQMRTELQRLQEELDVTTIYVTHDQTEAMTMSDRIAILDDGALQQVATPLEAYHRPANLFVASFIGEPSMNFFEMEVQDNCLVSDNFTYPISETIRTSLSDSTHVVLGIRPEDIDLVSAVEDDHDFETAVDVVEPKGDVNNIYLTFDERGEENVTFVAVVDGLQNVESGQSAVAHIPETAIHIFDTDTGQTLYNRSLEEVKEAEPRV